MAQVTYIDKWQNIVEYHNEPQSSKILRLFHKNVHPPSQILLLPIF